MTCHLTVTLQCTQELRGAKPADQIQGGDYPAAVSEADSRLPRKLSALSSQRLQASSQPVAGQKPGFKVSSVFHSGVSTLTVHHKHCDICKHCKAA